jgi:hypothetical protein
MTQLEILKAARALITPEGAWTTGDLARNFKGEAVNSRSPHAVCWCMSGAVRTASFYTSDWVAGIDALGKVMSCSVPKFNDAPGRTQAEVLAKFDEAIAALEGGNDTR